MAVAASSPALDFHLSMGRPSCAAVWPGVLMLLWFLRLVERPRNREAAGFAAFSVATLIGDQESALCFGLWLVTIVVFSASTSGGRARLFDRQFLSRAAAAAIIVSAPAWLLYFKPFLYTTGYTTPSPVEALQYSYPVSLLWRPLMIWRVYGFLAPAGLLAAIGLRRRAAGYMPWALGGIVFVILSFGPVAMGTSIPLPFGLFARMPGMAQFRTPYRFQIGAAIGMIVAGGAAFSWLLARARPKRARAIVFTVAGIATLELAAHRPHDGFAMQTMATHRVYDAIAADPRDCAVLEVPVGVRTGTDRIGPGEALSFYQPIHRKRLINGSTSRMPLAALAYYRSSPAIMRLAGESPPPGDAVVDLRRLIADLKLGYIVIHPEC